MSQVQMGKIDTRTTAAGNEKQASKRARPPQSALGGPSLPLEWMDGSSWRLPSGKALAEFALQAGFLAPLMLQMPRWNNKPGKKDRT
jgi:hypothetical protein